MKKILSVVLIVAVMVTLVQTKTYAEKKQFDTLNEYCSSLFEDYCNYYNIDKLDISEVSREGKEEIYQVDLYVTLKYSDPSEMDYYKGLCAAVSDILKNPEIDEAIIADILAQKQQTYEDLKKYIGVSQYLLFELKCEEFGESSKIGVLCGIEYCELEKIELQTPDELYSLGYNNMISTCEEMLTDVASNYSVSDAVAYYLQYTSNATSCNLHSNCGHLVDTTKYNSTYNHYASTHTDCCNFASQALLAGGIPTNTTWRPYTSAWKSVTSLTSFMDQNHYWVPTRASDLRLGNFAIYCYSSGSKHIMMITSFDGCTPKASAHTNDRLNGHVSTTDSDTFTMTFYRVAY